MMGIFVRNVRSGEGIGEGEEAGEKLTCPGRRGRRVLVLLCSW